MTGYTGLRLGLPLRREAQEDMVPPCYVEILGPGAVDAAQRCWGEVYIMDGRSGWVQTDLILDGKGDPVPADRLPDPITWDQLVAEHDVREVCDDTRRRDAVTRSWT